MSNKTTEQKQSRAKYLESLRSKVQEMTAPRGAQKQNDDRYWKVEVDKLGSGSAIIRFLSAKIDESFPFVRFFTHGFQGPGGKWYIENCPESIGDPCPACNATRALYATKIEANAKIASQRKQRTSFVSNILVINDPKHQENNGKVFLFRYGKQIFEQIKDALVPPPEFDDPSIDAFDPEEGCNFKLRVAKGENGIPSYEKSFFDTKNIGPLGDEDYITEIRSQLYSLSEIVDPKHFKSFDELSRRFDMVMNTAPSPTEPVANVSLPDSEEAEAPAKPVARTRARATPTAESAQEDFLANLVKQQA